MIAGTNGNKYDNYYDEEDVKVYDESGDDVCEGDNYDEVDAVFRLKMKKS